MKHPADEAPTAAQPPTFRATAGARRATLQDVAHLAGVSVSAVSKVVRGAGGVSSDMRAKVGAAVDELGYRPDAAARSLRGRSFTIGIVMAELTSPFQPEVAQAISEELAHTPYQDVIVTGGHGGVRQQRSIEALLDRQVDGMILVAPWLHVPWIEELAERVPLVAVALHGEARNFDTVVDDEALGSRLMVDHLVELGHRRILHTSMPAADLRAPFALSHTARELGFVEAMRRHGLVPEVIHTWLSEEGGYRAGIEALSRPTRPTAVFAGADIAALGVLRAAEELGLRVPEDVSVVGYDNIFVSTVNRISLTTVDQSGQTTGAASARLLLERIAGRTNPARYVVGPRLVLRKTSAASPGA